MTQPKRPLPSLRFVIRTKRGGEIYRLIPQTTPKGRVIDNVWAVPGDQLLDTAALVERCKKHGWRWEIMGETGDRRKQA